MTNLVEVKEMNLIGTIYDRNEKYIWIENAEDLYMIPAYKVTAVEEVREEQAFEKAMEEAGLKFDGYSDGEREFTYHITGFTYDVMASVDFENNTFYMDTKHKGLNVEDWANKKTYKKLSTLIKNVIKFTDK